MLNNDIIKTIEYRGYTINILPDFNPCNPRTECDNVTVFELTMNNYTLPSEGNGLDFEDPDEKLPDGWKAAEKTLIKEVDPFIILPVTCYNHSGLSFSIGNTFDKWDGGRVGFIYITKATAKENKLTKKQAEKIIKQDLETYNQYVNGDVYGYEVKNPDGDVIDSCWCFYGNYGLEEEAKSIIDNDIKEKATNAETLHADIKDLTAQLAERLDQFTDDKHLLKLAVNRNLKSIQSILRKSNL